MRAAELFAGYGGLAMAVEEVFGASHAWFSEFDAAPSKILAHHWPDVVNHGDVTKIDFAQVEQVDIISGGSPCQDLSAAGRRKGMTDGTRSNLWVQMRESIAIIKPTYVVWENVRGAYSAGAYSEMELTEGRVGAFGDPYLRALGRVLGDLSDLGYDCQWRGLRAADVGAPHGRFRVFVLATHRDSVRRERARDSRRRRTRPADNHRTPANAKGGGRGLRQPINLWAPGGEIDALGDDQSSTGRTPGTSPTAAYNSSPAWIAAQPDDMGAGSEYASEPRECFSGDTAWGGYEPAIRRWEQTLGRPAPAPTEPTGRNGAHRLSARFAEWMMGVPDGWICDVPGVSRNDALKAAGNGVVPQQAIAALRDMLQTSQSHEGTAA